MARPAAIADWLVPNWPAPPGVRALCTTRAGGASAAPRDSLNLGDHVGDAPEAVRANRELLRGVVPGPVFLRQVHGTQVVELAPGTPDGTQADGCTAHRPGVACTIMVADCLPVLFARGDGTAVGAAHAGWRGLAGGVLEAVAGALGAGGECIAWLGPCIGPSAFEVGPEVRDAFTRHDAAAAACFAPHAAHAGKWLADLPALARRRLRAAGVAAVHGNDGGPAWCTVANPLRFFSYRRDVPALGGAGRFAACVWRE
ncbi:peptidoglycan editing factor PgeF [Curvibacter soli]|uniref:peptidoglycan editing factor PgeF n=1 Tax=Curvibacter soli TaxID=3031331 RepID=UPI003AF096B3